MSGHLAHDWLTPQWPAPARVKSCVTTRAGGVSADPFVSLNLGDHVGDDPVAVAKNRQRLVSLLGCRPAWLSQVHGVAVAEASPDLLVEADASWSATPGVACAIMTADCLPALFCDRAGTRVAAAHAGWRGLAAGVLEASVAALGCPPSEVLVWLGPAIGPQAFEVGGEVRAAFMAHDPAAADAFRVVPGTNDTWLGDLYLLARQRLARVGVTAIHGGGLCTVSDAQRFYSFRRDRVTGRMASVIWRVEETT